MADSTESRRSRDSNDDSRNHPDFQLPWVQAILNSPDIEYASEMPQKRTADLVSNTMFNKTLTHDDTAIRRGVHLQRPSSEPDSLSRREDIFIISIGTGVDGRAGRAHGGFNSMILDHITGTTAVRESPTAEPAATAFLHVDYKAPILTPVVFLARGWVTEISGRKVFVRGTIEDGRGKVFASAKSLFVNARTTLKSSL